MYLALRFVARSLLDLPVQMLNFISLVSDKIVSGLLTTQLMIIDKEVISIFVLSTVFCMFWIRVHEPMYMYISLMDNFIQGKQH